MSLEVLMRNTDVFHYVKHSCWDPIPSEQKGQLCILAQIYHIILFSPTLLKLDGYCAGVLWNSCPGASLAATCRSGCILISCYPQSIVEMSSEKSGIGDSWKLFHTAGECGEKNYNETKEREEVCELSWLVHGILKGVLFQFLIILLEIPWEHGHEWSFPTFARLPEVSNVAFSACLDGSWAWLSFLCLC